MIEPKQVLDERVEIPKKLAITAAVYLVVFSKQGKKCLICGGKIDPDAMDNETGCSNEDCPLVKTIHELEAAFLSRPRERNKLCQN